MGAIQSAQAFTQQPNLSFTPDSSGNAVGGSTAKASVDLSYTPTNFDAVVKAPRLPCFSVSSRERNVHFFGRQDVLAAIDEALLPITKQDLSAKAQGGQTSVLGRMKSFALCGIGGSGKTELAVEYVHSRRSEFDAVFWVSADNTDVLRQDFARIATDLDLLDTKDAQDLPYACHKVHEWLSVPVTSQEPASATSKNCTWLLVFDNADKTEVLNGFWPDATSGSVLVTSRDPLAKYQTHLADQGSDISPFSLSDAKKWIAQLAPGYIKANQEEYVEQIATRLGGLPLLITEMSGLMSRLRISFKEFLQLCDEKGIEDMDWSASTTLQSAQVFRISAKLGLDGLEPRDLGLLQMLSLLDPDGIPAKVLEGAYDQKRLAEFPVDRMDYLAARATLLKSSLVAVNHEDSAITLHRIVQDTAKVNMGPERLAHIFDATLRAVSAVWPFGELVDRFSTKRYPECEELFPSVLRLKTAHEDLLQRQECDDPDIVAALYNDAGWYGPPQDHWHD